MCCVAGFFETSACVSSVCNTKYSQLTFLFSPIHTVPKIHWQTCFLPIIQNNKLYFFSYLKIWMPDLAQTTNLCNWKYLILLLAWATSMWNLHQIWVLKLFLKLTALLSAKNIWKYHTIFVFVLDMILTHPGRESVWICFYVLTLLFLGKSDWCWMRQNQYGKKPQKKILQHLPEYPFYWQQSTLPQQAVNKQHIFKFSSSERTSLPCNEWVG